MDTEIGKALIVYYEEAWLKQLERELVLSRLASLRLGYDFRSVARRVAKELGMHYRLDPERFDDPDVIRFYRYRSV